MGCASSSAVRVRKSQVNPAPVASTKRGVSPQSQRNNETSSLKKQRLGAGEEQELWHVNKGEEPDFNVANKENVHSNQNTPAHPSFERKTSRNSLSSRGKPEMSNKEGSHENAVKNNITGDNTADVGISMQKSEERGKSNTAMAVDISSDPLVVEDIEKETEDSVLNSNNCRSQVEPKLTKGDLYSDVSVFKEADEHALKAPSDKSLSMEDIANYLMAPFDNDLMKFRTLWRWITANIEYDVDSFFGKQRPQGDAFTARKGVCDGYATIAQNMFSLCGIESVKVSGWCKGYNYSPGQTFKGKKSNHSWNAIKLKDQWWLCDMTWGAGYVGKDKKFCWDYTEHYFLTKPDEFITNHLPTDPSWQLLVPHVEMEEFESWANFTKHFYSLKLKPLSHKEGVIHLPNGLLDLTLSYEKDVNFTVDLVEKDSGNSRKDCCFMHWSCGVAHFLVCVPSKGSFNLRIFGKEKQTEGNTYSNLVTYILECESDINDWTPFPSFNGAWNEGFIVHEPLSGKLNRGTEVKFRIAAPENIVEMFVCVKGDGDWVTLTKGDDSTWEAMVTIVETATEVKVIANDIDKPDSGYVVLLNYQVSA